MPLSTIFQLYRGGQVYWERKPEYPEKTTDLSQVTDKLLSHDVVLSAPLAWNGNHLVLCKANNSYKKCQKHIILASNRECAIDLLIARNIFIKDPTNVII
jgi:hypothetical protein